MARRDKTAVELLGVCENASTKSYLHRIDSLEELNLPDADYHKLKNFYQPQRMLWELIVQDCKDFNEFCDTLRKYGYKNLPINMAPKFLNYKNELLRIPQPKIQKIMLQPIKKI